MALCVGNVGKLSNRILSAEMTSVHFAALIYIRAKIAVFLIKMCIGNAAKILKNLSLKKKNEIFALHLV